MKLLSILLTSLVFAIQLPAQTLKVGDTLPAFKVKDQHGRLFQYSGQLKTLFVTFDMATGKKANAALAQKPGRYLAENKAAYLANIHGMPAIGRRFALPKMRKYPQSILLGDDARLLTAYPRSEGQVTVLKLSKNRKITAIRYWNPAKEKVDDFIK